MTENPEKTSISDRIGIALVGTLFASFVVFVIACIWWAILWLATNRPA